jgi:hypothetical protein
LEADALAVEGMERTRVLEVLIAQLKAEVRIRDVIIQSKDEALQSKDALLQAKDAIIQSKDVIIQSKDDQLQQAKDAQLRLHPAGMAPFNPDSAAVGAARQPAHAQAGGGVAAREADAKEGLTETKESRPKGSGRADFLCFVCNRMLPLSEFSGSQKKKKRDGRKCLTCALLPVPPGISAPRTPRMRKKAAEGDFASATCARFAVFELTAGRR